MKISSAIIFSCLLASAFGAYIVPSSYVSGYAYPATYSYSYPAGGYAYAVPGVPAYVGLA
ncbi:hypothetical protein X975_09431, partial [Stegodyphus mimosarum]